jgi:hypothetical protein
MRESTTEGTYTVAEYRDPEPARYARPRRRRGGWVTLLGVLLVLAVLAVVADRVAANVADRELRTKVVAELQARDVGYQSLDVSIGGFPFLTQVLKGTYEEITIDLTQVTLPVDASRRATLPSLHVIARGVNADAAQLAQGTAKVSANQVTGTAVVSFATLLSLIDFGQYGLSDVTLADSSGGLAVTAKLTQAGITVPISATADITVTGGQFKVNIRDATVVSVAAPQIVKTYLSGLATRSITARLPQLPFGLALDKFTVAPDGLAITATGHNVALVT